MSWKRYLRWTIVTGLLIGLVVGIYRFTPPAPMCVIAGTDLQPHVFAANGGRLICPVASPWAKRPRRSKS